MELVMEAALLCWVVAELPANLGELVAWDYSAETNMRLIATK